MSCEASISEITFQALAATANRMESISCWLFIGFGALSSSFASAQSSHLEQILATESRSNASSPFELFDDQYWQLMRWFYGGQSRISVHLVVPPESDSFSFRWTNHILMELTQRNVWGIQWGIRVICVRGIGVFAAILGKWGVWMRYKCHLGFLINKKSRFSWRNWRNFENKCS